MLVGLLQQRRRRELRRKRRVDHVLARNVPAVHVRRRTNRHHVRFGVHRQRLAAQPRVHRLLEQAGEGELHDGKLVRLGVPGGLVGPALRRLPHDMRRRPRAGRHVHADAERRWRYGADVRRLRHPQRVVIQQRLHCVAVHRRVHPQQRVVRGAKPAAIAAAQPAAAAAAAQPEPAAAAEDHRRRRLREHRRGALFRRVARVRRKRAAQRGAERRVRRSALRERHRDHIQPRRLRGHTRGETWDCWWGTIFDQFHSEHDKHCSNAIQLFEQRAEPDIRAVP